MAYYSIDASAVVSVCTAKQLHGFFGFRNNNPKTIHGREGIRNILTNFKDRLLIDNNYYRDFALVFVIVTKNQGGGEGTLHEVLTNAGFTIAFTADKTSGFQREKSNGPLYMYCINARDLEEGWNAAIEYYTEKEVEKPVVVNNPDDYGMLRLIDLKKAGYVSSDATLDNRVSFTIQRGVENMTAYILRVFGYDISPLKTAHGVNLTWRHIKTAQNDWKTNGN